MNGITAPAAAGQPSTTATGSTTTASSGNTSKAEANESRDQFLQLLVAQLKGQNPLNPLDGTQFVSQLAQFSSLEELTNVRSSIEAFHADFKKNLEEQQQATPSTNPFANQQSV